MPSVEGVDDNVPRTGYGVSGRSDSGYGVWATSSNSIAVRGDSPSMLGVLGQSTGGTGVYGFSSSGYGVYGRSSELLGVYGESSNGVAVSGESTNNIGVYGGSNRSYGVYGVSVSQYGVYGRGGAGAAFLQGNVIVTGLLLKGGGSFKIDHPLDPANKYLSHSFVESPDMKNVYDGTVVLDNKGEAEIQLPDWFGALNKDFRYQLTAIGAPGPNLYIAEEIFDSVTNYSNNSSSSNDKNNNNSRFKIAGGTLGMKVSWQVTGIRKDPWANANRILVEEDKPAKEQGYYIHPDLYGQPEEKGISQLLFPREEKWQEVPVK
jgi:hypothetical protein